MESQLWNLVDRYTQVRWWFTWPTLVVGICLVVALLLAVFRLHRCSPVLLLLTATALGGAAALLLPGLLLAWQPMETLGINPQGFAHAPTATFPAIAQIYERVFQFGYLGCAALLVGVVGTTGLVRERRIDTCPTCGRERERSWKGVCPECRLLEQPPADVSLLHQNRVIGAAHPITQFGVSAHTELLEGVAPDMAWLEVVDSVGCASERFAIGSRLTIGRDPQQCQCLLDDAAISARHAIVERDRKGFVLSDSGSRNGILVNGHRITEQVLQHGDMISIGHSVLRFIAPDMEAENTPTVLLEAAPWSACLVALNGPHQGTRFPIQQLDVQIGRGKENDIRLNTATVSRQHARLCFDGTGYRLVDLGSANGVWLNGMRVLDSTPLRHGQEIVLGKQLLRFEVEETADAPIP